MYQNYAFLEDADGICALFESTNSHWLLRFLKIFPVAAKGLGDGFWRALSSFLIKSIMSMVGVMLGGASAVELLRENEALVENGDERARAGLAVMLFESKLLFRKAVVIAGGAISEDKQFKHKTKKDIIV